MNDSFCNQIMKQDAPLPFNLPEWIALAPFEVYLGMHIDEAQDGRAVLSMPFRVLHCQGKGLMHGGAVVSLADTALAMAIKSILPENSHFATIEMALKFHAPILWGTVRAEAMVTERDERDISGEVGIFTQEGIRAATFTARFRLKRGTIIREASPDVSSSPQE